MADRDITPGRPYVNLKIDIIFQTSNYAVAKSG